MALLLRNRLLMVSRRPMSKNSASQYDYIIGNCYYNGNYQTRTVFIYMSMYNTQYRGVQTSSIRYVNFLKLFSRKKSADQYRISDGVDKTFDLVYKGDNINYIKGLLACSELSLMYLAVSFGTGVTGLTSSAFNLPVLESAVYLSMYSLMIGACFYFTRIYPLRIYFSDSEDKFVAVFLGLHPFSIRQLELLPGEVISRRQTYISENILPWADYIGDIDGKQSVIVIPSNFKSPMYYNKLYGY